ncbi:MAG: hypothetical protein JKY54_03405 [Flavobacteriales bacterium]|nr:hypothetical protein [Flavobacteriales bacterium]
MNLNSITLTLKNIFLILVLWAMSFCSTSQTFYFGIGGQVDYASFNTQYLSGTGSYSNSSIIMVPGINAKATLSITSNDFMNFAVSSYPFLGISLSTNSQTGGSNSFGIEIPINAELYLGDMEWGCFFIGAGWTFARLSSSYYGGRTITGPQADIGAQFAIGDRITGIRLSYTNGVNKTKVDDPTISIMSERKTMITIGGYYLIGY